MSEKNEIVKAGFVPTPSLESSNAMEVILKVGLKNGPQASGGRIIWGCFGG
jgi:hypothetical protein